MRRPSTPTALAGAALAIALIGLAPQAEALVSHARLSDNSRRLQGRSYAQVRAGVDATRLSGRSLAQVRAGINAATLGGQTAAQVRTGVDAAKLGGLAPGQFVQGASKIQVGTFHENDNSGNGNVLAVAGSLNVEMSCGAGNLRIFIRNTTGATALLGVSFGDGTAAGSSISRVITNNSGVYGGLDKPGTAGFATISGSGRSPRRRSRQPPPAAAAATRGRRSRRRRCRPADRAE